MLNWLVILFFCTALLYASVGFGGGSTYTALLVILGVEYRLVPILSLICNILVVSGNSWQYSRAKLIDFARAWPYLALSIPFAWIGGRLQVSRSVFITLLALALFAAGLSLLRREKEAQTVKAHNRPLALTIGAALGLLSGVVGIGGGIFLAPILHKIHYGSPKQIAALCSLFILLNSAAGLIGQISKHIGTDLLAQILAYWPLFPAVIIGGLLGNRFSIKVLPQHRIKQLTALLILVISVRLFWTHISQII